MTWQEEFLPKLRDARQALACVRSGYRVWIEPGCATPVPLVEALVDRGPELRDVEVVHMMTLGEARYTRPEFEGHFRHNGLFMGPNVREAVQQGRADYTPIFLSEIEELLTSGAMPLDVVLMQVTPPDRHGFVSLGTSVDCTLTAARCAHHVIAEVNTQMPRTFGDSFLHVSKISAFVETSRPLLELHPERPAVGAAMVAASADSPEHMAPCRAQYRKLLNQFAKLPGGFERAALVLLAVQGLLLAELLHLSPYTRGERSRLVKALLRAADQCGSTQ